MFDRVVCAAGGVAAHLCAADCRRHADSQLLTDKTGSEPPKRENTNPRPRTASALPVESEAGCRTVAPRRSRHLNPSGKTGVAKIKRRDQLYHSVVWLVNSPASGYKFVCFCLLFSTIFYPSGIS